MLDRILFTGTATAELRSSSRLKTQSVAYLRAFTRIRTAWSLLGIVFARVPFSGAVVLERLTTNEVSQPRASLTILVIHRHCFGAHPPFASRLLRKTQETRLRIRRRKTGVSSGI
jgi:hypothetical protein